MKFRTEISIPKFEKLIEHHHKITAVGSCFTENIGAYFQKYKFNIFKNPFGVIYNPVSVYNSLNLCAADEKFVKEDLIFDQDEYHSFYHHTDFSHHDADECLKKINTSIEETKEFLGSSDWVIISLGTAYVFRHKEKNIIVSNCHKIPANKFDRFRLSLDETKDYLQKIISLLKKFNNDIKIIFTVSPVRHWRDGAAANQLSKSTLLLAIDYAVNQNNDLFYFPSYELVLDDLRDYRFYKEDLLHPNEIASNYIWQKLRESLLSESCNNIVDEVTKIVNAASHKIRNPYSEKNQSFIKNILKSIDELSAKYPHINFNEEKKYFKNHLKE